MLDAMAGAPLKRRNVILMIVLFLVTLGLYYPIWFLRRRSGLNRLDSPRKLQLWPFVIAMLWLVLQLSVDIASAPGTPEEMFGTGAAAILTVLRLAVAILMVVQCFFIKDILEDHLAGPGDEVAGQYSADRVELSGLMTVIFQIFYLQHVINRHLAGAPGKHR